MQKKLANLLKSGWVRRLTVEIRELRATKNSRRFFSCAIGEIIVMMPRRPLAAQ